MYFNLENIKIITTYQTIPMNMQIHINILGEEQAGLCSGNSTADHIFSL